MGWGGFVFGRSLATIDGKLDRICEQYDEHEDTLKVIDSHLDTLSQDVRDLKKAWRGEDGTNGAKSLLTNHELRIREIEKRNYFIDETARREREKYQGPERRHDTRRERDRDINGLMPEEREDKG
jgi:chromosome segregation ATPase